MELLRETVPEITFNHPAPNTNVSLATWSKNGVVQVGALTFTQGDMTTTTKLPYQQDEGTIEVTWTFSIDGSGAYTKTQVYEVVTPILTAPDVLEVWSNATSQEVTSIERAVRHVINAHTGQNFGKFVGSKMVRGNNSISLALPARLVEISKFNGVDAAGYFDIAGDGFYLNYFEWGIPPVKADYYGLHMHVGGVIHNPNNVKLAGFSSKTTYEVNGTWGYKVVPEQVREAAKLLVNDYAGADTEYRDRYLTSMTAADWRIQFNSGAFTKTGNVRADQLLADYVLKSGWAVF